MIQLPCTANRLLTPININAHLKQQVTLMHSKM
jgi:hypothetical protein